MANHKLYTKWNYTLKRCKSTKNIKLRCKCSVAQSCPTLCHPMDRLKIARLLWPWNPPGKNTGVDCHFLLQGIFPTQGSNPCILHPLQQQADSLPLGHLGSNKIKIFYLNVRRLFSYQAPALIFFLNWSKYLNKSLFKDYLILKDAYMFS